MFKKNKNNELENLIVQTKKKEKIKKEILIKLNPFFL